MENTDGKHMTEPTQDEEPKHGRGWWTLTATVDLNDTDREHIARLIKEGYREGEIAATEVEE